MIQEARRYSDRDIQRAVNLYQAYKQYPYGIHSFEDYTRYRVESL